MLGTISGALARSLIQSWQKNRKNQQKNRKNLKKSKIIGTISGALAARSLIPYHFEWLYIQSWQKNRKNQKKIEKIKKN